MHLRATLFAERVLSLAIVSTLAGAETDAQTESLPRDGIPAAVRSRSAADQPRGHGSAGVAGPAEFAGCTGIQKDRLSLNHFLSPPFSDFEIPSDSKRNKTNVFLPDNRSPIVSTRYPWSCIGLLVVGDRVAGTAFLVSRDLVVTNAHVLRGGDEGGVDPRTGKITTSNRVMFYANYASLRNRRYLAKSSGVHVWWGVPKSGDYAHGRADDWAIVRLAEPLGDSLGWFGVANTHGYRPADYPQWLICAGYSGDFQRGLNATVDLQMSIRGESGNGVLLHDGDTARGASGGPIFQAQLGPSGEITAAFVYAVNAGERRDGGDRSLVLGKFEEKRANAAVPTSAFVGCLKELLK